MDELPVEKYRNDIDPEIIKCETTKELSVLEGIIGQKRAVKALQFGLEIKKHGFNIYVAGPPGTGKETAVKGFLEELAKTQKVPSDWCYVNNFKDSYTPIAVKLPPGKGKEFKDNITELIEQVKTILPETFQSEDYSTKREEIIQKYEEKRQKLLSALRQKVQDEGFVLQSSPMGLLTIPVVDGKPIQDEDEFRKLSNEKKQEIQEKQQKVQEEVRSIMRQVQALQKQMNKEVEELNHDVALYAIGHLIDDLKEEYKDNEKVLTYLEDLKQDIVDNVGIFIGSEKQKKPSVPFPMPWLEELPFRKYKVNLLVDNSELSGSPVVIEHNPVYNNLFGRVDKEAQLGALTTDFTLIRSGSLHKANGGYIVLPVEDLLRNILSWQALKRDLTNEEVIIEEAAERMGFIATKGVRPEPIPLDVKVVLLGNPVYYHLLYNADPDFRELFKVKADFDVVMDRTSENIRNYASFICTLCQKEGLKHLKGSAVAKVVEYASRLVEDQQKLATKFAEVSDIIREADFYAVQNGSEYVTEAHVIKAIEEKVYRSNMIQKKIEEMIERGFILIDTEGNKVGQVNGLSVISMGDFSFGRPSRLTASIGLGREGVIDIEREAKLGGRIHTKGVMILTGYLTQKYAQDKPLSLNARLVFEQSYEGVEGDSASSTEVYAILSRLSELPINQNIAVTGSVNQNGEVQAIGGVNEKIEGFFEVCKLTGLHGDQGVIIPESNVQNLMLKEEIVKAAEEGKFHIYPVKTIDEGIETLTGVPAGKRKEDGTFEEGTVNYKVNQRLQEMAKELREFGGFREKD
ncbi:MAG: AAA family ATPase [Candidatus Methanofastidiosia archaeon]|jgi:lon-related putative ATP-dependent protease